MPGEGSIYRRKSDGRYVATISVGPRGHRKVTTLYRRSRGEALEALADLRRNAGRVDSKTTVGNYLVRWLRDAEVRPNTRHGYQAVIDTHLDPAIGHIPLAALTPMDVRSMMARLAGSPKTRRNVLVVLRRALREAVRSELVARNVASPEYIDAPKVPTYDPDALTVAEVAAIMAVLPGDPIEAHVIVALGTGLRQGEQLGLEWQDIGPDHLTVRQELARIDGRYKTVPPKTDRSRRTVPLSAAVREALAQHREWIKAAGWVPIATGAVFVNTSGGDMSGSVLTHRWYRLLERAGVRRRPWKILRATFGTRLHDAGVDDLTIAALLGHTRTRTTRTHYIASGGGDPRAAVELALTRTPTDTAAVAGRGEKR